MTTVARGRGFVDGNKRTACVVTRRFLRPNAHDLSAPPVQRVIVFEKLGKGDLSKGDFAAWLRAHGRQLQGD